MTAPTLTHSAYPPDVQDLIPQARDLAAELGEIPSQNRLKKALRVGTPKARAVLAALTAPPALTPVITAHDEPAPLLDRPADPPVPDSEPTTEPGPVIDLAEVFAAHDLLDNPPAPTATPQDSPVAEPVPADLDDVPAATVEAAPRRKPIVWPVLILCLPAFVAIWGGWVEMGRLTGFGMVKLLPGIADGVELNSAITLPIGVETYAAYALYAWLSGRAAGDARKFAKWSALASLGLGGLGQVAYHLMAAAGWTSAPWPITAAVACIPVAVLGMGAALAHLMHRN
ncbi:ABC transporter permease [Actinoplanes sp. M2I2]|uniref:ABC transporter permease n=1 Tax=Actinoplanes sp. M2I2 TaxID=1734444 RepID=UPI00202193E6|nr:ABC transporter permease [Actinoplanes sp. M2I2]